MIQHTHRPLLTFNNFKVKSMGKITLPIYAVKRVVIITFIVVNTPSLMNVIMGRHWIHAAKSIGSNLHQVILY